MTEDPPATRGSTTQGWGIAAMIVAIASVAWAARVSVAVPGTPVPQSLQTLAVLVVGVWLGREIGTAAIVMYVVVGALGLPVFADGASGMGSLTGPTAGYLVGFIAGAALMGSWRARGWAREYFPTFGGMVAGHVVILVAGWVRLAVMMGVGGAFSAGVAPFLWGGLVKSAVGAGVWTAMMKYVPPAVLWERNVT